MPCQNAPPTFPIIAPAHPHATGVSQFVCVLNFGLLFETQAFSLPVTIRYSQFVWKMLIGQSKWNLTINIIIHWISAILVYEHKLLIHQKPKMSAWYFSLTYDLVHMIFSWQLARNFVVDLYKLKTEPLNRFCVFIHDHWKRPIDLIICGSLFLKKIIKLTLCC